MDPETRRLIEAIHNGSHKCVLALTGGGTTAAALLLGVPGGSRTILEVIVPYQAGALAEYLGRRPEQYCSAQTGREIAGRAFDRARWQAPGEPVLGVGCTASLATDRPKLGDHRFHLAVHLADRVITHSLILHKGARNREAEEAIVDAVLLNALAAAMGIAERVPLPLLADEELRVDSLPLADPLSSLLRGELSAVCAKLDGQLTPDAPRRTALLCGAFNPVHAGHWYLAETAHRILRTPVAFELSAINVDKPPLPPEEIRRRLAQFTWRAPVWVTRAPTFAEKASLFAGAIFVVGADTAQRIVAPRYYHDSAAAMIGALERIRGQGCRFLVAGREGPQQRFISVEDLGLPESHRDLFAGIPESEFQVPISSTALRAQAQKTAAVAPAQDGE
jgi:hypothetical protein